MDIIAKNKIADYIEQHPEAQIALLIWLKEFPYRHANDMLKRDETSPVMGISRGEASLGLGDYTVQVCVNPWLKTSLISWLGSADELVVHRQQEMERLLAQHPDVKVVTKQVTIKVPSKMVSRMNAKADKSPAPAFNKAVETIPVYPDSDLDFKTIEEYYTALERAVAIFDARPETPEFDELSALLPLIKKYEFEQIRFPAPAPLDVIKLKMKERLMSADYPHPRGFVRIFGGDAEAELYLSGQKILTDNMISKLYRYFKMPE